MCGIMEAANLTEVGRMKKYLAAASVILLLLTLTSCVYETDNTGEIRTYEVPSGIHALFIEINAADLSIIYGDSFWVESNLTRLTVTEAGGVLSIVEAGQSSHGIHSTDGVLTLCIPHNTEFDSVSITTGVSRLTADTLSANSIKLELGTGQVRLGCLNAYSQGYITGGAGEITIESGELRDLHLEMGAGELNLRAALQGNSDLSFGVGSSTLMLIGSMDDYRIQISQGIGSIRVNGEEVSDFGSGGNGQNSLEIHGGIGTVDIAFDAE